MDSNKSDGERSTRAISIEKNTINPIGVVRPISEQYQYVVPNHNNIIYPMGPPASKITVPQNVMVSSPGGYMRLPKVASYKIVH